MWTLTTHAGPPSFTANKKNDNPTDHIQNIPEDDATYFLDPTHNRLELRMNVPEILFSDIIKNTLRHRPEKIKD